MSEDNLILLISYLFHWVILTILILLSEDKKKKAIINFIIQLIYSVYFLHGLFYDSGQGAGLAWFLFLLFIIWMHGIINLVQLIILLIKKHRTMQKSNTNKY